MITYRNNAQKLHEVQHYMLHFVRRMKSAKETQSAKNHSPKQMKRLQYYDLDSSQDHNL